MALTYNGTGEWIPGIPAQDLSDDDIARIAGDFGMEANQLIDSLTSHGLYSPASRAKTSGKSSSKSSSKSTPETTSESEDEE